jgi:5-(carboxyamino)imidazole ribonucleotide synthase
MGDALGVVGGGQLGRYFVLAAQALGYTAVVLEPDPHSPAGAVADEHIVAAYDDESALDRLASSCRAVTVEFENPPVAALERLARSLTVRPSPSAVAIAQDRRSAKQFCRDTGLAVAPFAEVNDESDARRIADGDTAASLFPAILKTARLGYDGKGQRRMDDASQLFDAFVSLGSTPCVLEQVVPLDAEFSVVVARGADGEVSAFAPTHNVHVDGILDASTAPFSAPVVDRGHDAAVRIASALDYVGVLAVEFFVSNGALLVNELAPRPHNSGHWTLNAARTSQFEQQVFALTGMALGDATMTHRAVAMVNLLGDRWQHGEPRFALAREVDGAHLHLYGKREARAGRKMGHLTMVGDDTDSVLARARALRASMTLSDGSGAPR